VQLGGGGGGGGGGGAAWVTVNVWPAMVIVPVRTAAVFAATVKLTDPLPVPAAPAVIVIHDALLTAVHAHVPPAVTVIAVPAPPASAIDSLAGAIVLVQLGAVGGAGAGAGGSGGCDASCCVIVCVRSAMVTVPVRAAPGLAAMRNATEPLPLPCAPDVIVIHEALLVAVHVQPFNVDTATLAVTELELTVWASGAIVSGHVAASCITRTWLSLTTISPARVEGVGFAAARNATLPLPWPEVGETSEIQLGWLETVHSHSG